MNGLGVCCFYFSRLLVPGCLRKRSPRKETFSLLGGKVYVSLVSLGSEGADVRPAAGGVECPEGKARARGCQTAKRLSPGMGRCRGRVPAGLGPLLRCAGVPGPESRPTPCVSPRARKEWLQNRCNGATHYKNDTKSNRYA